MEEIADEANTFICNIFRKIADYSVTNNRIEIFKL